MDRETQTQPEAATVTPLDQVLWGVLSQERALAPFARAWLALLCRMLPGVVRAVLVLRQDSGMAPVARWPDGDLGSARLSQIAELALKEQRGVVSRPRPTGRPEDRTSHLALPLTFQDQNQGVVAVEIDSSSDTALRDSMRHMQWGTSWIELQQRRIKALEDSGRLQRGYTALEVTATALATDNFEAAARAVATELAVRLNASRVTIGWQRLRSIRIAAFSHAIPSGKRADVAVNLAAAMDEAVDQGASLVFPLPGHDESLPSRSAHARLAGQGGGPNILTVPLTAHGGAGGRITGAITVERDDAIDQSAVDITEAVSALVGPVLEQLHRNERWLSTIAVHIVARQLRHFFGAEHFLLKLSAIALVAVVAFFSLFHVEYRVSAQSVVEGEVRRAIAAGLDGYIGSQNARAGQIVRKGDTLATLDDSELNMQRLRWIATRQQHQSELDKALATGTRADVVIDTAQIAEAQAEIALLDVQLARTKITAPFDGLITNGDLSQSVGMPIQRAQVLFEIAPLDSYRVIIHVPDSDIAHVAIGRPGSLVLSALPDQPFGLHVTAITPITEQADGANTFRVEAKLDTVSAQLRPNMEGVAKIDAGRHLLIWVWTHHLIDAARLWLWSWWP
jgi:multidrug resistance efflux pump